jgi:ubiquinone/menaquinone biosynthesis C-methylase UbiE
MAGMFDGIGGGLVAAVMARANRDAEIEAVERLDPRPDDHVLAIGFGAGVGIEELVKHLPRGLVTGIDPSAAMMKAAGKRLRGPIAEGRVILARTTAAMIPAADAAFDGAIAVNSLQLCEPIAETAAELARTMKPRARLISLTHDWAILKHAPSVEAWTGAVLGALAKAGFVEGRSFLARAENGRSVAVTARRA